MSFRRMIPFILINVLVSAAVVLGLLYWWDNRQTDAPEATVPEDEVTVVTVSEDGSPPQPVVGNVPDVVIPDDDDDGLTIHVVKSGDTLGGISIQYDVTIEDIMAANGLDVADFLQINQELVIPIDGIIPTAVPEADPVNDNEPDEAPTPIPAVETIDGEAIVDIAEVVGVGILPEESVSIANTGTSPISLGGWRLEDEDGFVYTFGQITLFGEGAAISLFTGIGEDGLTSLYWGLVQPIWREGETARLYDANGEEQISFTIGNS